MFPLSRTCVKIAAAGALIVLAASATLANEMIQKSGPVGPHEPILVTVGQKHVIAFFRSWQRSVQCSGGNLEC